MVFHLGDFGCKSERDYLDIVASRLNGWIRFMPGNHDDVIPLHVDLIVPHPYKYKKQWLSHCPMHPDELRGNNNIHGHIHSHTIDDPRYFNVCCERIDFQPIPFYDVVETLRKRT